VTIEDTGVVLRATPVRESDLLVTLYTSQHGRLSAVARGARRSQRRFAGALSLLVLARYQLARTRGELWALDSADIVREWTSLATDVIAHAHASYAAELVGALVPAEQPEPEALALMTGLWDALAAGGPSPGVLRAVELHLLDLAGHMPALDRCAACGSGDLDSGGAVFDPSRGGAICRRCAATSRGPGVRPLDAGARAYLLAIAGAHGLDTARAVDAAFAPADRVAARDAVVAMVVGLVGRPLRSLEYLAKLGAAGR
jgi:DNA repair protein RecO (recombination protein O)